MCASIQPVDKCNIIWPCFKYMTGEFRLKISSFGISLKGCTDALNNGLKLIEVVIDLYNPDRLFLFSSSDETAPRFIHNALSALN